MSNEERKLDERVDMVGPILAARAKGEFILADEEAEALAAIQKEDDEFKAEAK